MPVHTAFLITHMYRSAYPFLGHCFLSIEMYVGYYSAKFLNYNCNHHRTGTFNNNLHIHPVEFITRLGFKCLSCKVSYCQCKQNANNSCRNQYKCVLCYIHFTDACFSHSHLAEHIIRLASCIPVFNKLV